MDLKHVVEGDRALLYMERYVDEGTRTYSPFAAKSEVAPEYQPRSDRPAFELIAVLAPKSQVTVCQADPVSDLRDFYLRPNGVKFLIHPETWASPEIDYLESLRLLPRDEPIQVAPTASTRTVLTADSPANVPTHFIKLHYPRRISRFNRRLRRKNIQNSVEVSRDLAQVDSDQFAWLPDVLGIMYGDSDNAWGYLVREGVARPHRQERCLIPFFSLYAGDLKRPEDPPLLVQLIERLGVEPQSFVIDEIMVPVVETWVRVVRERGILLESHGQNILLEIDQNFRPCRIVHRDSDVWVDDEFRASQGLAMPFVRKGKGRDMPFPREQHYSLVYDHFIGRELFDYLLQLLIQHYGADEAAVRSHVAAAFEQCFPDARDFFPARTTYYFSNEIMPGNEFHLVDTGQAPKWR